MGIIALSSSSLRVQIVSKCFFFYRMTPLKGYRLRDAFLLLYALDTIASPDSRDQLSSQVSGCSSLRIVILMESDCFPSLSPMLGRSYSASPDFICHTVKPKNWSTKFPSQLLRSFEVSPFSPSKILFTFSRVRGEEMPFMTGQY